MIFIKHSEVLDGRVVVVEIEGHLDSKTSPDFEQYINRLLEKDKRFILLNSQGLQYISSEGIGLVLLVQKKISEKNGSLIIFNLSHEIRSLYSLLGFDKIFRIAESRIEAMQTMDKQIELINMKTGAGNAAGAGPGDEPRPRPGDLPEAGQGTAGPAGNSGKFTPIIVECAGCGAMVRVRQSGDFLCPECNREFTVEEDRSITFRE
mgnify:CR=1 FL=1